MAGHSKWANTKFRKERQDKKRSAVFAKVTKEIVLQARNGDPDPAHNAGLAQAIDRAKAVNLPKDNIERAIKRATGDLEGITYEEMTYEGYGPEGVAVLVRVVTDNRNRAAGIEPSQSEVTMIPKNTVKLDGSSAEKVLRLITALDDNEDVQEVFANFDIPDEIMEKVGAGD